MIRKLFQLSALLIAFAGITRAASVEDGQGESFVVCVSFDEAASPANAGDGQSEDFMMTASFIGAASTPSVEQHAPKVSKNLFLGKYEVVDNGPILEEELSVLPSRPIMEEQISAPQYLWNRGTRTWEKNPRYSRASSTGAKVRRKS